MRLPAGGTQPQERRRRGSVVLRLPDFTKAGVCTCHSIKEETVNEAVLAKVSEVCRAYLEPWATALHSEGDGRERTQVRRHRI